MSARPRDYSHLFRKPGCKNWLIRFRIKRNGISEKIVRSSGTTDEKEAREFRDAELAKWRVQGADYVGPKEHRVTFKDLRDFIERDYRVNRKRSLGALKVRMLHLEPFFSNLRMVDVTQAILDEYCDRRLAEFRMVGAAPKRGEVDRRTQKFAARASVSLEMACLKHMFRLAVNKGSLSKVPAFPKPLLKPNENARQGFVERATFEAIRFQMPEDLRDPLTFLYLSTWRPEEMRSLEWRDVDEPNEIIQLRAERSKNGESKDLPCDSESEPELCALMIRAKANRALCPYVFHRRGRKLTVSMFRKRWIAATKKVGQPGILIYDLRRSGIREHMRSGTDASIVMKLSGHRTMSTFQRYNIKDVRDLRAAMRARRNYLDAQPTDRKVVPIDSARGQLELPTGGHGEARGVRK